LTPTDLLLASQRSVLNGNDPLGGVRVATVGPQIPIVSVEPPFALLNENGETVDDLILKTRIVPASSDTIAATVSIRDERGNVLFSAPVPTSGAAQTIWPKKQTLKSSPKSVVLKVRN